MVRFSAFQADGMGSSPIIRFLKIWGDNLIGRVFALHAKS